VAAAYGPPRPLRPASYSYLTDMIRREQFISQELLPTLWPVMER
jgi:hypothetical protein